MHQRIKSLLAAAHLEFAPDSNAVVERLVHLVVIDAIDQIRKRKEIAIENGWNVDEAMTIVEVDIEDWFGIEDDNDTL
jgi:hypothetical protein